MVEEPNDKFPTKHRVAELLQAEQLKGVRNIYHGMDWGKGLDAIYSTMEAKVRFIAEDNSKKGIKQLPISVYVLWGGNDVFGNYGYVGCRWSHEKRFNRTEAGRKAASEFKGSEDPRV